MTDLAHAPATAVERVDTPIHPLIRAAQSSVLDAAALERLEKLMRLNREFEADEAKKAYTRAMVDLKRDLPAVIHRDAKVSYEAGGSTVAYRHASLAGAVDAVQGHMARHGFSHSWDPSTPSAGIITVVCEIKHAGGHSEKTTISGPADKSGGKNAIQAVASTITYLERYSLLAMLGIATKDMQQPGDAAAAPPTPEVVNADFNLSMAGKLSKYGKTVPDAEKFLGRKIPDWTMGDLDRLKEWIKPAASVAPEPMPAPAAEREPGDDDFAAGIEPPALEPMSAQTLANLCTLAIRLFGKSVDVNEEAARALGDGVVCDVAERDEVEADKIMAVWNAKLKAKRL